MNVKVTGAIVISSLRPAFSGGVGHIVLEDTSRADAKAIIVSEVTIPGIVHGKSDTRIPFTLEAGGIDQRKAYSIRTWIDVDDSGVPGPHDLFSSRSHPVLTRGFGDSVEITL